MALNVRKIANDILFEHVLDIIGNGESVTIMVSGHSMMPTFVDGVDKLVLSPFDPQSLKVGDVVLFDRGDQLCVHRIISRDGDNLVIRGDGNSLKALEKATLSDVKGLVTGGTMRGGKPFMVGDGKWEKQTEFVTRNARPLAAWHRVKGIITRYPLSALVCIILFALSFFNTSGLQIQVQNADKWVHLAMYFGVASVFWMEWMKSHGLRRNSLPKAVLFCVILPIVLGGVIEVAQEYLTDFRSGEPMDFMADFAGVMIAVPFALWVIHPVQKKCKARRRKQSGIES